MPSNKAMVREIEEVMDKVCTEWEIEFIESIKGKVLAGAVLTEKQQDKLLAIYHKVCRSPY